MPKPTLTSLLALAAGPSSEVEYVVGGQTLTPFAREQVAHMLADDAMELRCGKSPTLARWRAVRNGDLPPTDTPSSATVATYAQIGFGLPTHPANDDHLQVLVAELLWNRLSKERKTCSGGRVLIRAHSVKPDPLEPGGDGLVVYKLGATYVFRLWEIKKHDAKGPVSGTINRASRQLARRGNEYLAKLAGPDTIEQRGPLGAFYADLVELWLDGSERAGVGVAVGTSDHCAHSRPTVFRSLTKAFPQFAAPGQTEGMIVAVPDFPEFAARVREIVWSGL